MKLSILIFMISLSAMAVDKSFTIVNHEFKGTKQWLPGVIIVEEGDEVEIKLINNVPSGLHGFYIPEYKIKENLKKDSTKTVKFTAGKAGVYPIKCHLHKAHVGGQLVVINKSGSPLVNVNNEQEKK